jgi:cobalt-zinc-cadmium efflux system membrane fusion protein
MGVVNSPTILIVNGDEGAGRSIGRLLAEKGYAPVLALSIAEAMQLLDRRAPQLAILADQLPDGSGLNLARQMRSRLSALPLILVAPEGPTAKGDDVDGLFQRILTGHPDSAELCRLVAAAGVAPTAEATLAAPVQAPRLVTPNLAASQSGKSNKSERLPASAGVEKPVVNDTMKWLRAVAAVAVTLVLVAGLLIFTGAMPLPWKAAAASVAPNPPASKSLGVELVKDMPNTVAVPDDVRKSLSIRKGAKEMVAVAKLPTKTQTMVLPGSTALDPTRLYRIRARFAPARVVEIAPVVDEAASLKKGQTVFRELRAGDKVKKGDLLGVFYSVDVGSKKNDLIDAVCQLKLDEEILEKAEKAFLSGALPEVFLLNARRNVEADRNAERRAVNTLKTWDIPEEDIKAVYEEAAEMHKRKGQRDPGKDKLWPKVELRAPDDGTIVERNVAQHEMVVDNTVNLFQIAKVDRLLVLANAPEDDLPTLNALDTLERVWTVRTVGATADKGLEGPIDEIGYLIDPNQHTAIIKGHVDNPGGRIRGGQFVSATIQIPPPKGVVEVPIDAIVEDGQVCVVFVESSREKHYYTMRRVQVTHRFDKTAFVRSEPIPKDEQRTAEEAELDILPKEPLRAGERVLTSGVGELKAALLDLESQSKSEAKDAKGS